MDRKLLTAKLNRYRGWASLPADQRPPHTGVKMKIGVPYLLAALEKAQKGTYGICEDCNLPIDPRRLRLVPGAIRCTACQAEMEKNRR